MEKAQQEIRRINRERDWEKFHTPDNLAKSIAIEAGELLECFQWSSTYNPSEVSDELADIFNYCFQLSDVLGVDPETIILNKLKKVEEKYPINKAKGVSIKYNKLGE